MLKIMEHYLRNDYVRKSVCEKVDECVNDLREHVMGITDSLKFTVTLCGSYGCGLASVSDSLVDVIVKIDGRLTRSLDQDGLVRAFSSAIKDWSSYGDDTPVMGNTGLIICRTKDPSIVLRLLICNSNSFPIRSMYHTRLFLSYANSHCRVPVFVATIKRWARVNNISSPVALPSCPLNGFHWTIISLAFLIENNIIPNLGDLAKESMDIPRIQYGTNPSEHIFALIEESSHITTGHEIPDLFVNFVNWLSKIDLLSREIDLQTTSIVERPPMQRGYLVIRDPCSMTSINTVDSSIPQRDQIVFGLKVRKAASVAVEQMKRASVSELVYTTLGARPGSNQRIDVAVP
jgi:hypothetical protein